MKLNAKELRKSDPTEEERASITRNPITIILDNVLDTYNVGSIFRLADAVAAQKVILAGDTLTPPNSRIKKASVDTWKWVPWEYAQSGTSAIEKLRKEHPSIQIVAVEQDKKSMPFQEAQYKSPVALVVGHESDGVNRDVLKMVDEIVEIPQWGVNRSLNVMVSTGIVLYEIMRQQKA